VEGWERFWVALRRYSFPVFVVLFLGGIAGALYWGTPLGGRMGGGGETPARLDAPPAEQPTEADRAQVPLTVHSTPAGAAVRINGDSVGTTPLVDRRVEAGVYLLSVRARDHFRSDTVVVLRDSLPATLRVALRPRPGTEAAATPAAEPSAAPVEEPTRPVPVTAVPRAERAAPAPTPVEGALYVTSTPPGATVAVDGRERGRTPVTLSSLAVGEAELGVTLDGYVPWNRSIPVEGDAVGRVHAELEPQTGRLRVLAQPWGTVYIDGTLHVRESDVWYETSLPAGRHRITVVHPVLGTRVQEVELPAGGSAAVIVDLQEPPAEDAQP
jgi:hypothetical protein